MDYFSQCGVILNKAKKKKSKKFFNFSFNPESTFYFAAVNNVSFKLYLI